MDSKSCDILRIVSEGHRFFVPRYQRLSSWEKEHYTKFAEDIFDDEGMDSKDFSDGYFIGTFILKADDSQDNQKLYEVIDGQQRLIAISLLLAALYKIVSSLENKYESTASPDLLSKLLRVSQDTKEFLIKGDSNRKNIKIRFTASEYSKNNLNFIKILQDCHLTQDINIQNNIQDNFQHSLMTKSFKYYEKFLNEKIKKPSMIDEIKMVEKISKRITKISFIFIKATSQSNAYQLFESFNNRGKPLVAMDIIKNIIFKKGGEANEDMFFDKWNGLTENLISDTDKNKGKHSGASQYSDRYLRHFYNAFNREDEMYVLKSPISKVKLIEVYEKLINGKKISALALLNKMHQKSKIYNAIIDPAEYKFEKTENIFEREFGEDVSIRKSLVQLLKDLNDIKGVTANVLLLYLFSKFSQRDSAFKGGAKTVLDITDFLVKFFVRRNISQFPRTNMMDPLMDRIIQNCDKLINSSEKISLETIEDFVLQDVAKVCDKEKFKNDLLEFEASGPFDRRLVKIVLLRVSGFQEKKAKKKNLYFEVAENLELEHILPQSLPPDWVKEFTEEENFNNVKDQKNLCKIWLHRLGNLTLTRGNPSLSNSFFADKQRNNEFGYKHTKYWLDGDDKLNGLIFSVSRETYTLANAPTWRTRFVEERNKALVTHIADFYQFKSEKRN